MPIILGIAGSCRDPQQARGRKYLYQKSRNDPVTVMAQRPQESPTVVVVAEKRLLAIPSTQHMVNRSLILHSHLPRHAEHSHARLNRCQ
jgi:hypothetical protein